MESITELRMKTILNTLHSGGVILYPTDTVWGIGCDACNAVAVRRVFDIKHRAPSKSVVVLAADEQMLTQYVGDIPPQVYGLLAHSKEPLTVVYPHGSGFAEGVCAADGSVAVRIPRHTFCKAIIEKLGYPLVSTSANLSGGAAPAYFADIADEVKAAVDLVVGEQWEGAPTRSPSHIVQLSENGEIKVIR
jgi:L-threonylcarbamoyladenylate synthase